MSRILVGDDEVVIADTMSAILGKSGYEARALYDTESALSACMDWSSEFVIRDAVMPRMCGVDMAMEIKQRCPSCKILLIPGQVGSSDLLEAARAQGYL
ncbi:MAG TPA: response regulator [Terracidiphilus sp.]|jgi:DNA-binding NtrC family response regulator|nr:response regulator [Terracidiphilus sp.]